MQNKKRSIYKPIDRRGQFITKTGASDDGSSESPWFRVDATPDTLQCGQIKLLVPPVTYLSSE